MPPLSLECLRYGHVTSIWKGSTCLTKFERVAGGGAWLLFDAWPGRLARCGRQDRHGGETAGSQQAAHPVLQGIEGGQEQDFGSGRGHHGDGPLHGAAVLTGPRLPDPAEQVDGRTLRPRGFSDDARTSEEHVWALMGMPCGKYLVVMLGLWLPLLAEAGDLDKPFATGQALAELEATSAANAWTGA